MEEITIDLAATPPVFICSPVKRESALFAASTSPPPPYPDSSSPAPRSSPSLSPPPPPAITFSLITSASGGGGLSYISRDPDAAVVGEGSKPAGQISARKSTARGAEEGGGGKSPRLAGDGFPEEWQRLSCYFGGSVFWTRIRIWSGSRRAKMTHKSRKIKKFHVLKCLMFSFEGWRLLL
jgi:hypothetical protein